MVNTVLIEKVISRFVTHSNFKHKPKPSCLDSPRIVQVITKNWGLTVGTYRKSYYRFMNRSMDTIFMTQLDYLDYLQEGITITGILAHP